MADQSQPIAKSPIGSWNMPAMSPADLQTIMPIMQDYNNRSLGRQMVGGDAQQVMQYQQEKQKQEAATQLETFLKMQDRYPGMKPTPGIQQAYQTVMSPQQNPMQQLAAALGINKAASIPSMPDVSPTMAKGQDTADAYTKLAAQVGPQIAGQSLGFTGGETQYQQEEMALKKKEFDLKQKAGGLTPWQAKGTADTKEAVISMIKSGAVWDPMTRAPKKTDGMTKQQALDNLITLQLATKAPLISDPDIMAAIDEKYPEAKKPANTGPGMLEKATTAVGNWAKKAAGDVATSVAGAVVKSGVGSVVSEAQQRLQAAKADPGFQSRQAAALKQGATQQEIDDLLFEQYGVSDEQQQ